MGSRISMLCWIVDMMNPGVSFLVGTNSIDDRKKIEQSHKGIVPLTSDGTGVTYCTPYPAGKFD